MVSLGSRIVWIVAAAAWAVSGLVSLTEPAYWSASTVLDWAAVWAYSSALLLLAPAVLLLARLTPSRSVASAGAAVAVGVLVAGSANALEDGFGMKAMGMAYVGGLVVAWLSIGWLAYAQHRAAVPRLAGLSLAMVLGMALVAVGGGIIVAASLTVAASASRWLVRVSSATPADPPHEPEVGGP